MNRMSIPLTLWVVLTFPHTVSVYGGEAAALRAIKAKKIYVGNGQTIDNGIILIRNGQISAVGCDVAIPEGTPVIEVADRSITPGLIDANSRIETINLIAPSRKGTGYHQDDEEDVREDATGLATGVRANHVISEQDSEVVPHTFVLDGLNLGSGDFDRLLRGGVTTVYASPDPSCVISPRGAILRTGGPRDRRILVPAAAVKATIGSEPSTFGNYNRRPYRNSVSMYARRPNSRMGLTWVFRKAFYDAIRRGRGIEAYGADTADPQASAVLRNVLDGKVGLRIQARIQRDILTALRLADEFNLKFTLEDGTEAYRCIEELKAASVPVIFGPIYEHASWIRARASEARRSRYWTFRALVEAGIPTALSAQELREEDGLARQAMYAMRFGVGFDDALRAVTDTPARLLGLDTQLGTIEPGKRADLVIWKGRPLAATSIIEAVLIDGNVVMKRR